MALENGKELFELLYRNGPDIGDGHGSAAVGEDFAKFTVACLVLGLGHVHSKQFAFRDLKPESKTLKMHARFIVHTIAEYLNNCHTI